MKHVASLAACLALSATPLFAQVGKPVKDTVELEYLTHSEVAAKMAAGATSVLIVNGGTEERGPHNILGGHTIMSRATAIEVAQKLGNTLVAPVMPIDVGATGNTAESDDGNTLVEFELKGQHFWTTESSWNRAFRQKYPGR